MKFNRKSLIVLVLTLFTPILVFAYTSPGKPTGFVNDFANVISAVDKQEIENKLVEFGKTGVAEISVVTISALGDETIETYAVQLFEEWGIGSKSKDNGLLILVAPNDRQVRIEVGYGLEGAVTDIQSGNVINKVMIPAFKTGDYSLGIKKAVDAVIAIISNSPEAALYAEPDNSNKPKDSEINFGIIVFFGFIILNVLAKILGKTKSWWLGGVMGAGIGVLIGIIFSSIFTGVILVILLTILGLFFDYFVSKNPPGSGGSGGIFPMFFGGGGHGGGGGFGGFGGGMSGGGGASGRW